MPKIEKVNLSLKISKQVSDEPFTTKSLSLGAEAAVSPNETFEGAAKELYHEIASELRLLWNLPSEDRAIKAQAMVGDEEVEEPPTPPSEPEKATDPSWCPIHNVKMKRREKGSQAWYSHKAGDAWCKGE